VEYVEGGYVRSRWMGTAKCRICGVDVGDADRTDLTFLWPAGLSHYVKVHRVSLGDEFEAHAVGTMRSVEMAKAPDEA
jgi:hypothetical protein